MNFLRTRPVELSERIFNRMFEKAKLEKLTGCQIAIIKVRPKVP